MAFFSVRCLEEVGCVSRGSHIILFFCSATLKIFSDSKGTSLGNLETQKCQEKKLSMTSILHQEVSTVYTGETGFLSVRSDPTDPPSGDRGFASEEWASCRFFTLPAAVVK